MTEYFREQFPKIKLSDEAQKNELIAQLYVSPNFSTTHLIIAELDKFDYFTSGQVSRLFQALVDNDQVGWIGTDDDVNGFYKKLEDKAYVVPDELMEPAAAALEVEKDEFFFPF